MKLLAFHPLVSFLLILITVFECSNGSDIIHDSCREASKSYVSPVPYNFCVASLTAACSEKAPTGMEELVLISMQLLKANTTNMISTISNLLKDPKLGEDMKVSLKNCFDSYSKALSYVDEALGAFSKSKDKLIAEEKIGASSEIPDFCDEEFDSFVNFPLMDINDQSSKLNNMCYSFLTMLP